MHKDIFYQLLAEIHTAVEEHSCGCMGSQFTPERVERDDTHDAVYDYKSKTHPLKCEYVPVPDKRDYIGNIVRKYVKIEDDK